MGSLEQTPHLVITGVEPWGHARPMCTFAAKVALARQVHVTLFTTPRVLERVKAEVSRNFGPEDAARRKLVRVVAVDNAVKLEGVTDRPSILKAETERYVKMFVQTFQQLLYERPITCGATKTEIPAVAAPKILVIDFILGPLARIIPKISGNQTRVIGFCSGMPSYGYLCFAPPERGGRADLKERILRIAQESGRSAPEVADELVHTYSDDVCQIPGFPKMHHWEYDTQDVKWMLKGLMGGMWLAIFDTYEACSGLILTTPEAYEPEAIAATKDWWAETQRQVWAIGPLLPSVASTEAVAGEEAQSPNFSEIKQFMDRIAQSHGEHSLLYISFGSAFWPSNLDTLEAFIDVVIEKKIPFIFSHGAPIARLTDSFKAKVVQCGLGVLTRWSPQQTILAHPVLGWFVTHCGHNSTLEAISADVPMICWPFHADQPANAVHLSVNHEVAYELLEVRTGNGLKPIYRTGKTPTGTPEAVRAEAREVLEKAFGEDGARKRANVHKLKESISAAWSKGGSAEVDMGRLLDTLA